MFYSYILNILIFYLYDFLYTCFLSIVGGSMRFKNVIANCVYVTVVDMTIKILNLDF